MVYGLHISTAGNLAGTPARAAAIGAKVFQYFASNPRGWRPTHYTPEQAAHFRQACKDAGIEQTFIHMIYLVGYGSVNDQLRQKSIEALEFALQVSDMLGTTGVVTHLGSHKGQTLEQGVERLCGGLEQVLKTAAKSYIILENSAGAGENIGDQIEELAMIIDGLGKHPRVKVCLDTAHLLGSGYEIRTKEGLDKFLSEFDTAIGLDRLVVMHLNDSKLDLGTHGDRHENIGDGFIGREGFEVILNHPKLKDVPGILEVPGLDGKGPDAANLARLVELTK